MTERITLDLSGTEDATTTGGDFLPLPKGWYKFFIYSAEVKRTSDEKGNKPYLNIRLNLDPEEKKQGHSSVVFDGFVALYTTEKAPWLAAKAEQLARISGIWDGEDRANVVLPIPSDIEGLEVEAYLKVEVDDYAVKQHEKEFGEKPEVLPKRNQVSAYRPVGGWPKPGEEGKAAKGGKAKKAITL